MIEKSTENYTITLVALENNGIEEKSNDKVKVALTTYFWTKRNIVFLFDQLYTMKQNDNEPIDNFYMRVKEKVQQLDLSNKSSAQITELLILVQLVNATNEPAHRTRALKDSKVKLKEFLDNARAFKMAKK